MVWSGQRLLLVILLLTPGPILAQGVTADLSLRVVEGIPDVTPPGSQGSFVLEITNNGPDAVVSPTFYKVSVGSLPFMNDIFVQAGAVFFIEAMGSDCYVTWAVPDVPPDRPSVIEFSIYFDDLPVGKTRTCEVRYAVDSRFNFTEDERTRGGSLDVEWYIFPVGYTDPNPDNDAVVLPFRFWLTSRPIPTLGPFGLALMAAGIFGAFVALRRSRRLGR